MSDTVNNSVVIKQEPQPIELDESATNVINESDELSNCGTKRIRDSSEDDPESAAKKSRVDESVLNENSHSMESLEHTEDENAADENAADENAADENAADENTADDEDRYLYSSEQTEDEIAQSSETHEYPSPSDTLESCGLPLHIEQFLHNVYDWDPDSLKRSDEAIIKSKLQRNLKDVLNVYTYSSNEVYKVVNIPLILYRFYRKLRSVKASNRNSKLMQCSVVMKYHNPTTNTLEMKCILMRKPSEDLQLNFGVLVELRTVTKKNPNSPKVHVSNRSYFGYIRCTSSRNINMKNPCESNHTQLFEENDINTLLVEEFIVATKPVKELYSRNDYILQMDILENMYFYIHQARTVFDIERYRIHPQFLQPQLKVRPSGICISLNPEDYNNEELDAIQKCVDVVCNFLKDPYFVCLKSAEISKARKVMEETIKQLLKFITDNDSISAKKLLITAKDPNEVQKLYWYLKNNFNVCLMGSEFQKRVIHDCKQFFRSKMKSMTENKELNDQKRVDYDQLKQLYEHLCSLDSNKVVELSPNLWMSRKKYISNISQKLLEKSQIIVGTLEDICSDTNFYFSFKCNTMKDKKILACFVFEANLFTEPEIFSLLHFGVEKFILCTSNVNNERHKEYYLNRSLFERLYNYSSLLKCDTSTSSIIELNGLQNDV